MHDADDRACVGVRMVAHHGPHCYENTQSTPRNKHSKSKVVSGPAQWLTTCLVSEACGKGDSVLIILITPLT